MKYLIIPDPKGTYATATGRRVNIIETAAGKDYPDEAAFSKALNLLEWDVYVAKETTLAKLQKQFEADLAKGYHDATLGITIAIEDADRRQFNDLDTHLTRKDAPGDSKITIKLLDGTLHTLTCADFHQLIIRAGDYYLALWTALQQKKIAL